MVKIDTSNEWWSQLRQNGMIISTTVLNEILPDGPEEIDERAYEKLRDDYTAFLSWYDKKISNDNTGYYRWIDAIFDRFLAYPSNWWQKGPDVTDQFKTQTLTRKYLRADRVLLNIGLISEPRLLLKVDKESKRIGRGRGKLEYSELLELLRKSNVQVGIITNGHQIRLVYAGLDHDCWVEWEVERWFEDAEGLEQLKGFLSMIGHNLIDKTKDDNYPLLSAIKKSRERQGELSQVLGEQTREAVELLIKGLDKSIRSNSELVDILRKDPVSGKGLSEDERNDALYQASIRMIMRIVVALFAEARDLLPKDQSIYHSSYGIEGLFSQMSKVFAAEGEAGLEERNNSWPRILSLFRLVYDGSAYSELSIPKYGGVLFKGGKKNSPDPVLRALYLFEEESVEINDEYVYEILKKLKIGKVRTKVGRSSKWVSGPVDFSDLRTEYIGMMYEGLLDYHLRTVSEEQEAIVFLNIGQEPALPFSLLKSMSDKELKDLLGKLDKESSSAPKTDDEEKSDEETDQEEPDDDLEEETEEELEDEITTDEDEVTEEENTEIKINEIMEWAENAIQVAGKIKLPKGKQGNVTLFKKEVRKAAKNLVKRIVLPHEMYLIRGSGTRKGTGTFYTKPGLAVPTVHRTLEPLVYDVEGDGEDRKLTPKKPEDILSLKVCDPAMGSGSFLVAALRYMTDGLAESLWFYDFIKEKDSQNYKITLPEGHPSKGLIPEDLIPGRPDDDKFEQRLKSRLKRYIVERCIYGVDLNPLAVELGKLSLWVETMDRELPFEFLDHKLKCGNSLVGTWFDRFQDYPVMAWMREGGDKGHKGVHFENGAWTNKIKEILNTRVKPEMVRIINGYTSLDDYTFKDQSKVMEIHEEAVKLFQEFHQMPLWGDGFEQREDFYNEHIKNNEDINKLKDAFDLWCSIWFWPGDWLYSEYIPTPENFYNPSNQLNARVSLITQEQKFFHWELEFPEVFVTGKGGFDAIVGNPPWETLQPLSKEFFTKYDPIFRTYGKQVALTVQKELFSKDELIEREWLLYNSDFKAMGNVMLNNAYPWGDPEEGNDKLKPISFERGRAGKLLHERWRKKRDDRIGFADKNHPFMLQGEGKAYTYKLFLEFSISLLNNKGRMGLIVPSGIYTDKGTTVMRKKFINKCSWEWLFGFENRKKIFDIDSRFKFCPVIVEKGSETMSIKTTFMKQELSDWENPFDKILEYSKSQVTKFSPNSEAILEIRTEKDLEILEKIYNNSVLLGDQSPYGWQIKYAQGDFNMTSDSNLFPPRTWWEEKGYKPDQYGRWLPPEGDKFELIYKNKKIGSLGDIGLPLYEGRMIGQFDFSNKGWVSGKGRTALWRNIPWDEKVIESQYYLPLNQYKTSVNSNNLHNLIDNCFVSFMDITSSTNMRTMISSIVYNNPCGNSAPLLFTQKNPFSLCCILNSFVYDFQARLRCGGLHLNYFVIDETAIPLPHITFNIISKIMGIAFPSEIASPLWIKHIQKNSLNKTWKSNWALTKHERLRYRCILDSIVGKMYKLNFSDISWILKNDTLDFKGFWRVDKDKPQELRHTTLTLVAFRDLEKMIEEMGGDVEKGIQAFCKQNDGEGWMIPEKIRFIQREDGTLDFDTPDSEEFDVRSKLGPRFFDWQLEGTPEESWKECEMHARNILGDDEFERFMKENHDYNNSNEDLRNEPNQSNKVKTTNLDDFLV